jgi:hypothetical protein
MKPLYSFASKLDAGHSQIMMCDDISATCLLCGLSSVITGMQTKLSDMYATSLCREFSLKLRLRCLR